eukprot:Pgem_evm1s15338
MEPSHKEWKGWEWPCGVHHMYGNKNATKWFGFYKPPQCLLIDLIRHVYLV